MVHFNNGTCTFMKMGNMICIIISDGSFLKGSFNRKKGILMLQFTYISFLSLEYYCCCVEIWNCWLIPKRMGAKERIGYVFLFSFSGKTNSNTGDTYILHPCS